MQGRRGKKTPAPVSGRAGYAASYALRRSHSLVYRSRISWGRLV